MSPIELSTLRKKRAAALLFTRKKLKITKLKLSQQTGLSRPTIDRIESGEYSWSIDTEMIYLSGLHLNEVKN